MSGDALGLGGGLWVAVIVIVLVVGRFLLRELRDRRIPFNRFYVLPAFFVVVAVLFDGGAIAGAPGLLLEVVAGTLAAIAVGAVLGLAVDRFTSVRLTPDRAAAIVRGSWITAGIWIVALLLRLLGRFVAAAAGLRSPETTFALNAVLIVMIAVALFVLRWRLHGRATALLRT